MGQTLSLAIAAKLRERVAAGEWKNGDRLPGEHILADEYHVSRATIRTALQDLASRGLTVTRRGAGTFVTGRGNDVRADLRQLESLTETIQNHGRQPSVRYRSVMIRRPSAREALMLDLAADSTVVAAERAILADNEIVAFSFDVVPRTILAADFEVNQFHGSLFALLERNGARAVSAVTEVNAVHDPDIGWDLPDDRATYLLLEQVHFDAAGRQIGASRTYFLSGKFQWGLIRHR